MQIMERQRVDQEQQTRTGVAAILLAMSLGTRSPSLRAVRTTKSRSSSVKLLCGNLLVLGSAASKSSPLCGEISAVHLLVASQDDAKLNNGPTRPSQLLTRHELAQMPAARRWNLLRKW